MTYVGTDYMPLDRQLFPRDLAAVVAELARQKHGTAKATARAWGIDPATAENLFKGHLSIPTLLKAVMVEGRDLWEAIGTEVTGETYEQFVERKLQHAIREAADARQNLVDLRARRAALDALAGPADGSLAGPDAKRHGPGPGRAGRAADERRAR